jgi:hypothetical protein
MSEMDKAALNQLLTPSHDNLVICDMDGVGFGRGAAWGEYQANNKAIKRPNKAIKRPE